MTQINTITDQANFVDLYDFWGICQRTYKKKIKINFYQFPNLYSVLEIG
jgi:hypothetical protein